VRARVSSASEVRGNGTRVQANDTNWRLWSASAGGTLGGGAWQARLGAGSQGYFQTFSAIGAGRATERITSDQRVPARFRQGAVQWAGAWRAAALLVGGEGRWTRAAPVEQRFGTSGAVTETTTTGGIETGGAAFARLSASPVSRATFSLGVRGDWWHVAPRQAALPAQSSFSLSPKASFAWRATDAWSLTASAYRASRSPSLNELYRGFRAGNVVTLPNPALEPERHTGVEGGALWRRAAASARVIAYWSTLTNGVTNVTLATTPSQVTRQRQNADALRASGVEAEADWKLRPWVRLNAAIALSRARFHSTPAQPALEGRTVPQSPSRQLAAGVLLHGRRAGTWSLQVRHVGRQFDDDLNELPLESFTLVGLSATRELARGLQATLSVENVFDATVDVGRTLVRSIGWPRSVRVGVRWLVP
jgi:outer membrane receptor protein involved in Fe transport